MLDALAKRVPLLEFFPYLLMCPPSPCRASCMTWIR